MIYVEIWETKSHSLDDTIELSFVVIDLGLQPNLGMGEITIKGVKRICLPSKFDVHFIIM